MKQLRLSIDGMTCDHCSKRVHDALTAIDGLESCEVRLEANCADVTMEETVEMSAIAQAVTKAGYRLDGFSPVPPAE